MKKVDPIKLVRIDLRNKIKPYTPSQTIEQISKEVGLPVEKIVKMDTGENPYVEKILNKKIIRKINFYSYPDPFSISVREKLSEYIGFGIDWILCGNGSDELINLLIRVFATKNDEIIITPPTFPMYEFSAQLAGTKVKKVIRNKNFSINTQSIIKNISSQTKLIFIDSPNNPTGNITDKSDFEKLLQKNVIVVADEAYFEYCNKTVISLIKKYPNLIILRTLSKWAGLAGLRIGYMVANPKIIKLLLSIKQPYNVNSVAQAIAGDVLDRKEIILKKLSKIIKLRKEMIDRLREFSSLEVFSSEGAYVVFKPQNSAEELKRFLRKEGVLVRTINQPLLENCIRLNIGQKKEVNLLFTVLKKIL